MAYSNSNSVLLNRVAGLLNNSKFSDVEFIIKMQNSSKIFFAHRVILAMASTEFASMFYTSESTEYQRKVFQVHLQDVAPHAVFLMLSYLYEEKFLAKNLDDVHSVLNLAKQYKLQDLEEKCFEFITNVKLTIDNVIDNYKMALEEKNENSQLLQKCRKFVCDNATEILKGKEFPFASVEVAKDIISQDGLNIASEVEVFTASLMWSSLQLRKRGLSNSMSLRTFANPLLPHIRILTLSLEEFLSIIKDHDIFTDNESAIIVKHIMNVKNAPLPTDICSTTRKRNVGLLENWTMDNEQIKQLEQMKSSSSATNSFHYQFESSSQKQNSTAAKNIPKLEMIKAPPKISRNSNSVVNSPPTISKVSSYQYSFSTPTVSPSLDNKEELSWKRLQEPQKTIESNQFNDVNMMDRLPKTAVIRPTPIAPSSDFGSRGMQTFNFQLQNLQSENVRFVEMTFLKCTVKIKMVKGCIAITGMELKIKKEKTHEVEIMWSYKGANEKWDGSLTDQFKNDTVVIPFQDSLKLSPNEEGEIEVMVDNIRLKWFSVLKCKKLELNAGLDVKAEIELSSNQDAMEAEFFFFLSRLHYVHI